MGKSQRQIYSLVMEAHLDLKLLAVETSSEWCSAALWLDGDVQVREALVGQAHSERLLPMVEALLCAAAIDLRALDAVAFGSGPGSFTGLRIACGVAQGLAFGAGIPVVGVTTLAALAEASGREKVIACLDARMNEIYCAHFLRSGGDWQLVQEPLLTDPAQAPLPDGGDWIGVGSGFAAHGETLAARYGSRLVAVRSELHPSAREIAILGAADAARGLTTAPEAAHPLYLRDRVALTVRERAALKAAKARVASDLT